MKIQRRGSAVWWGGSRNGRGAISTESGALRARIPGVDAARFAELAVQATASYPASKLLRAQIELDTRLEGAAT